MRDGYVKLHRSIIDWEWYADLNTRCLLMHLLVTVNYREGRFMGHAVPPGSVVTSLSKLSESCGLSVQQTRTALKRLEATGEVTRQSTGSWTLVTLVNWEKYQGNGTGPTRQSTRNPTSGQQGANTELTTIEEGKKERREEGKKDGLSDPDLPGVLETPVFRSAWARWVQHRSEIRKPVKPTMAAAMIKQLEAMGHDRAVACIDHTIAMGWQGLREAEATGKPKHQPATGVWNANR